MDDSALFRIESLQCLDLAKSVEPIRTGIGFLDHMVDQLNSHAQIGVALTVMANGGGAATNGNEIKIDENVENRNRFGSCDQDALMRVVGSSLGRELDRILIEASSSCGSHSRFCCPLDEALVVCNLYRGTDQQQPQSGAAGCLSTFQLSPYGKYPKEQGRQYLGSMKLSSLAYFWKSLAEAARLDISLTKLRGDNAHHIVEASFKSFSRALRNLLDGTDTTDSTVNPRIAANRNSKNRLLEIYGPLSENHRASVELERQGQVQRKTKETSIDATLTMDGGIAGTSVDTGIRTLDNFLNRLFTNANMSMKLSCKGDLWIDEHHTAEDVAIAIGQVIHQALGTKAGLNRMWCAAAPISGSDKTSTTKDKPQIEVTMDLSNRPCLIHNLNLYFGTDVDKVGDLSLEMLEHVLESMVINARITVHIDHQTVPDSREETNGNDSKEMGTPVVDAIAEAFGKALRYCTMVDCRRAGATASSKGTLSV